MSYYDDLGLPPSATDDEIRARYRELVMVAHPDHGGDPLVFRLLTEAYEVLGDPAARRTYDAELAGAAGGRAPTTGSPGGGDGTDLSTAADRWATSSAQGSPSRGNVYEEVFEGLASLDGADLRRLGLWVLASVAAAAAVGAGIGLFTGQATALAFGFALPAAIVTAMAFGHSRYRDGW